MSEPTDPSSLGAHYLPNREAIPSKIKDADAESPDEEEAEDVREVIRSFLYGNHSLPEAVEVLAVALAARWDIPFVPEMLEQRILRAVADLVLEGLDEVAEALDLRESDDDTAEAEEG